MCPLQNPIYTLFTPWTPWTPSLKKNFEILGGLFDPPSEKKVRDIYDQECTRDAGTP